MHIKGDIATSHQAGKYCFTDLFMVESVPPASLLRESEGTYCTEYTERINQFVLATKANHFLKVSNQTNEVGTAFSQFEF